MAGWGDSLGGTGGVWGGAFRRKHHPPILEAERERGQGVEGGGWHRELALSVPHVPRRKETLGRSCRGPSHAASLGPVPLGSWARLQPPAGPPVGGAVRAGSRGRGLDRRGRVGKS